MRRKDVLSWIKREAKKLEPDTYVVRHKYWPNSEFDENGEALVYSYEEHNVSHARRLKRCYDLGGFPLIEKYLNHFGHKLERHE